MDLAGNLVTRRPDDGTPNAGVAAADAAYDYNVISVIY